MQASDIQNFVDSIKNHELLLGSNLYRIYYYDSQPLKNLVDSNTKCNFEQ